MIKLQLAPSTLKRASSIGRRVNCVKQNCFTIEFFYGKVEAKRLAKILSGDQPFDVGRVHKYVVLFPTLRNFVKCIVIPFTLGFNPWKAGEIKLKVFSNQPFDLGSSGWGDF